MRNLKLLVVVAIFAVFAGCSVKIPGGYQGMKLEGGGFTGKILNPGNHSCWGRSQMYLIETKEENITEKLQILCADDVNFTFDLKQRTRLTPLDEKKFKEIYKLKGADAQNIEIKSYMGGNPTAKVIKFATLYKTYVQPEARSVARTVVSKYATTDIRENREAITKKLDEKIKTSVKGTPMQVITVNASNFDYDEVVTNAMKRNKQREIEIKEEKFKQAVELLKADNRLKLAQKMKEVRAAEAQQEAAFVRIMGGALTSNYLKLKEIEAKRLLYDRVQAGDKVIVKGDDIYPMVGTK